MSDMWSEPIQNVLGERGAPVKVEPSWGEGLESKNASGYMMEAVKKAIAKPSARRNFTVSQPLPQASPEELKAKVSTPTKYFFAIDENTLRFIGSRELDMQNFVKDMSGLFMRKYIQKEFPEADSYNVACFDGNYTIQELSDMLGAL